MDFCDADVARFSAQLDVQSQAGLVAPLLRKRLHMITARNDFGKD